MIGDGDFTFIHYAGGRPPMLFDLANAAQARRDLGENPAFADVRARSTERQYSVQDPAGVDQRARANQRQRIDANGGREATLVKGTFRFSPPSGTSEKRYCTAELAA